MDEHIATHSAHTPFRPFDTLGLELIHEIIGLALSDYPRQPDEPDSPLHLQWLSLRHTCQAFFTLIGAFQNPYQRFELYFGGNRCPPGRSFNDSLDKLTKWSDRVDALLSAATFPVTVVISTPQSNVLSPLHLAAVFEKLMINHIPNALHSLELQLASPSIYTINPPPLPNLRSLRLTLDQTVLSHLSAHSHHELATNFHFRTPKLRRLYVDTNKTWLVRLEALPSLTTFLLDLMRVGTTIETQPRSLREVLLDDEIFFPNFSVISQQLTSLHLRVRTHLLADVEELHLPKLQSIFLLVMGPWRSVGSAPTIRIQSPCLETAYFRIADTRFIAFDESTFPKALKRLVIATPFISDTPMTISTLSFPSSWYWANSSFIVHYPVMEEITIAIHGLKPNPTNNPPIIWPSLKRLVLVPEAGIADFLSHIQMPTLEEICIVYPGWCTKAVLKNADEAESESSRQALEMTTNVEEEVEEADNQGSDETDDDASDDIIDNTSDDTSDGSDTVVIRGRDLLNCYRAERDKIKQRFTNVPLTICGSFTPPDKYFFDNLSVALITRK